MKRVATDKADDKVFEIGGHRIAAGESRLVELPVASLYTKTPVSLPVRVLRGREPGPTLFVSAALHGDEIIGVEIIRRLLQQRGIKHFRGDRKSVVKGKSVSVCVGLGGRRINKTKK